MVDRFGILPAVIVGTLMMSAGYVLTAFAPNLWAFALAQGVLVGGGTAAFFGPLMTDISMWFVRHRGITVTICAAGNYLAGALWPSPMQYFIQLDGWRATHIGIGVITLVTILPLTLILLPPAPLHGHVNGGAPAAFRPRSLGISPNALQAILCVAGIGCCVAMAMPQVHIVAYCGDLGYGVARGAEMLLLILGVGIISRIGSGIIADRIGGVGTLLIGSALQGVALVLYFLFNGLTSLYIISALFGLFQGGIVPSYAIIVREYFPPKEAGVRVGTVLMATLVGMALGGWLSGAIFDMTGSYRAAFANGIAFNLLECFDHGAAADPARPGSTRTGASLNADQPRSFQAMPLSMYQASVPPFLQMLDALEKLIDKTMEHAAAKKIDPSVFINARLAPDMFPLVRQVQIAADFTKNTAGRLAGVELPKYPDEEKTFEELKARIAKTVAFLKGLKPAQIDGSEDKDISIPLGGKPTSFKGQQYLINFALPNLYFHLTAAYAILRHNGVPLGKLDFLGKF